MGKEVQIDHLQSNSYHLAKKNYENQSSISWDKLAPRNHY